MMNKKIYLQGALLLAGVLFGVNFRKAITKKGD